MKQEWIVDRLPTAEDANEEGIVIVETVKGKAHQKWRWETVELGQSWLPWPSENTIIHGVLIHKRNPDKIQCQPSPDFDPYNVQWKGVKLDPYRVIDLFEVKFGPLQQVVKTSSPQHKEGWRCWRRTNRNKAMNLEQLIAFLEEKEPSKKVLNGFGEPHSDRGDYSDLAFDPVVETTYGEMLKHAKSAMGKEFFGYKGGVYLMEGYTTVLIGEWGDCGELISRSGKSQGHYLIATSHSGIGNMEE